MFYKYKPAIFDLTNLYDMEYIPKILKTDTKKGEHTLVRKHFLQSQISSLEIQRRSLKAPEQGIMESIFNNIAFVNFRETLQLLINEYKLELGEYYDKQEQYNS